MAVDRWVGLQVAGEDAYQRYREEMTPLLHSVGGRFVVDVRVSEVLKMPGALQMNRLFLIRFPDRKTMDVFFSSEEYLNIRKTWFDPSVKGGGEIIRYETGK